MKSKPDWSEAPSWATWLAEDQDGEWTWYEHKPVLDREKGIWTSAGGRFETAEVPHRVWYRTAEARP
jgi:hypothetical protein